MDPAGFPPLSVSVPSAAIRATAQETDRVRPATSYAAALRPASPRASKKNLEDVGEDYKPATIYNDKPGIFYTEEEVAGMAEPFKFALIGKFSGMRPKPQIVLQAFRTLGLSGFYNIRFLRSGYIFMHLTTSEDMARVWTRGIWYIGGVPLRIFKWTPNFSYSSESSVVPVWIQLPDLPIHMFNKKGLFSAAKIVGNPIKLDEATADCSRLTMARVCVEIDLLKPKVEEFWIGIGEEKRLQQVIYERVPNYCTKCLHLGHSEEECYANGNRPKPQWRRGKEDANEGRDDLRVFLNQRYAEGKEKETTDEPLVAREEVSEKIGGEKQVWVEKKGKTKVQSQEKSQGKEAENQFQMLETLEEEEQMEREGNAGVEKHGAVLGEEDGVESRTENNRQRKSNPHFLGEEEQVDGHSEEQSDDILVRDSVGGPENSVNGKEQVDKANEQEASAGGSSQQLKVPEVPVKGGSGPRGSLMPCTVNTVPIDSDQWRSTSLSEDQEDSEGLAFSKSFVEEEESEEEDVMPVQRTTSLNMVPSNDANPSNPLVDSNKPAKAKEKNWNIPAPSGMMTRSKSASLRASSSSRI